MCILTHTKCSYIHSEIQSHADSVPRPRLPHGIEAIKKHIEEADDVPLRVSMYVRVYVCMHVVCVYICMHVRVFQHTFATWNQSQ